MAKFAHFHAIPGSDFSAAPAFSCSCAPTTAPPASIRKSARLSLTKLHRFTGPPRKNGGGDLIGQSRARFGQALSCRGRLGHDLFSGSPDGRCVPLAGLGDFGRLILEPAAAYLFKLFVNLAVRLAQLGLVLL